MIRKCASTVILSITVALTAAAATPDPAIDLALNGIGTGSATEIRERILAKAYSFIPPHLHERVITALPSSIKVNRITSGFTFRRAEALLTEVLELYGRGATVELVLYRSELPQAMLFQSCVLVLSDALASQLTEAELLGIIAHEVAHTYFMDELIQARKVEDRRAMKIVELKCDGVAVLTLKLLGHEPGCYITGLKKREKIANSVGLTGKFAQTNPYVR